MIPKSIVTAFLATVHFTLLLIGIIVDFDSYMPQISF
jgi:hypothetical protein